MPATLEADVVVVGAGPVGLTLANLLADQGVRTLLVERNPTVGDEPRAISITDESLRVMAQIGILPELAPEMLMDTGARYFGRKGQLLAEVKARAPRLGQPVKSQFDQPILVRLLAQALRGRPQAELRFGEEVCEVQGDAQGVSFTLASATGRRRARAQWLVACDGGRSPIRTGLGIALDGSTQEEKWIVVDVENTAGTPEPFSQFHCNGVRPCVVVPGVKGRCRYEFMLLPGDDPQTVLAPDSIVALVAPYQRIAPRDIRRAAVYVAQQRIAQTYRKGRIVLAGDAAHLMPPFAGQGLNAGVRDAANLAWKLAACVRGGAGECLIDTYEAERRPHAAEMVRLSYRIGQVVMSTHPLVTAVRDHLLSALRIVPAAREWVVGMKFLKQPHFTAGCVLAPAVELPAAAAALVGRALPQPRVCGTDGRLRPLDDLLGSGWAVLHFSAGDMIDVQRPHAALAEPVADPDRQFGALHGSGIALVLRPDRYVAAAAPRHRLATALEALDGFMPGLARSLAQAGAVRRADVCTSPIFNNP